jgi:hypothetical protein
MRLLARQILRFVVVAVALGTASLSGYASVLTAFDTHAHGHHGTHSHPAHDQDHERSFDAGQAMQDEDPASDDQPCKHVHMHCCSSVAMAVADVDFTVATFAHVTAPVADSLLPLGQLSAPLYRPPRAFA